MSDRTDRNQTDDDTVERLLKLAGNRDPIPDDIESRVHARVRAEWQASVRAPQQAQIYSTVRRAWTRRVTWNSWRPWITSFGLAASVLLAVALLSGSEPEVAAPASIASVVRVAAGDAGVAGLPRAGTEIYAGDEITTGPGQGLGLLLAGNTSLRIDADSAVRFDGRDRFTLVRGRVYADTGEFAFRRHVLNIDTAMGSVADVGTQFAVAVDDVRLAVAVREGRVDVRRDDARHAAVAGERLTVDAGGSVARDDVAPHGDYWAWTNELAPVFELEGRSLLEFLKWAARETGRELVFADDQLRAAALRTDLHGSLSDFSTAEAIESVIATTGFRARLEKDRILIYR